MAEYLMIAALLIAVIVGVGAWVSVRFLRDAPPLPSLEEATALERWGRATHAYRVSRSEADWLRVVEARLAYRDLVTRNEERIGKS